MSHNLSHLPENDILTLVQEGNDRAYGELYRRHLDEIYRYLYYRVAANSQDAEDLAQEVFIRAWDVISRSNNGRNAGSFRALVYRIAHNLSVDRWRTRKNEQPLEDNLGVNSDAVNSPEQRLVDQERTQEMVAAVRELEPQLQNVFICRFLNNLSHAETAQSLGLNEGHVRVLQHRALKKIRMTLD